MIESPQELHSAVTFTIADQLIPQPARWFTFVLSVQLHLLVILVALTFDELSDRKPYQPPTVAEMAEAEDLKITWYRPEELLPAVEPTVPLDEPQASGAKSRFKLKQTIAATSPNPDSLRQMIVNGPPAIKIEQDVEAANMLALARGREVKYQRFELRSEAARVPKSEPLPDYLTPRIDVNAAYDELAEMQKLERLRYLPADEKSQEPARKALEALEAPVIDASAPDAMLSMLNGVERLRYEPAGSTSDRPGQKPIDAAAAPQVSLGSADGVDLTQFQQIQRLRFAANGPQAAVPSRGALTATSDAPQIAASTAAGTDIALFRNVSPLRYEVGSGTRPTGPSTALSVRKAIGGASGDPQAPEITAALGEGTATGKLADPSGFQRIAKPRFEQWGASGNGQAPGKRAIATAAGAAAAPRGLSGRLPSSSIESLLGIASPSGAPPPPPPGGGGSAERNRVVVGVNPGNRMAEDIPRGQRSGNFSGGPEQGDGSDGGATQIAKLRVPNLSIGGRPRTDAAIAANPAYATAEDLQRLSSFRSASELPTFWATTVSVDRKPEQIDPDRPFRNKPSYSLAINMPNITSYGGSWQLQFAEIGRETEQGKLLAPTPRLKVDPRYVREAVEEKVEGEVVLHGVIQQDGTMAKLQVIRGIDDRLDASALSALSKWRFDPAQKYGQAVAVEAVIRIPFQLRPPIAQR